MLSLVVAACRLVEVGGREAATGTEKSSLVYGSREAEPCLLSRPLGGLALNCRELSAILLILILLKISI